MEKFLLQAVIVVSLMINFALPRRLQIMGGEITDVRNCPYQAAYLAGGKLKCGASIISDNWALTAGHCVAMYPANITLRIGSALKSEGGQVINITEIVSHPNFDRVRLTYDFALLKFGERIKFNDFVQPIRLPEEGDNLPDGTECLVSGWGKMENEVKPSQLRSVAVYTVNTETCQNNYNTSHVRFRIVDSMLCAGVPEGQKDACSGDSGGPLVCKGLLFGDVSSGYGCGLKDFPGIYGRVTAIRQWIKATCGV